jgi:hypothetical protein
MCNISQSCDQTFDVLVFYLSGMVFIKIFFFTARLVDGQTKHDHATQLSLAMEARKILSKR